MAPARAGNIRAVTQHKGGALILRAGASRTWLIEGLQERFARRSGETAKIPAMPRH